MSLAPALVVPISISAPAPRADGYTIVMRIAAPGQQPADMTFKISGERMRLEADIGGLMGRGGGRGGAMMAGAYMLPRADGNLIIVLPGAPNMAGGTGMAMSMNPGAMAARGAAPPQAGDVVVEDLGSGGTVLGHSTHKYRIKPANADPMEAWFATDVPGLDYKKFASSFGASFTGSDAKAAAKMPTGFPLKMVGTGTNAFSLEVTKIDKSSFADSDFEVPSGMQVMDMGAMMGGRGRGNQ